MLCFTMQEIKSLQMMLERSKFEKSRQGRTAGGTGGAAQRSEDLYARYDAIKRGGADILARP